VRRAQGPWNAEYREFAGILDWAVCDADGAVVASGMDERMARLVARLLNEEEERRQSHRKRPRPVPFRASSA
jgi:hypothetical protein